MLELFILGRVWGVDLASIRYLSSSRAFKWVGGNLAFWWNRKVQADWSSLYIFQIDAVIVNAREYLPNPRLCDDPSLSWLAYLCLELELLGRQS